MKRLTALAAGLVTSILAVLLACSFAPVGNGVQVNIQKVLQGGLGYTNPTQGGIPYYVSGPTYTELAKSTRRWVGLRNTGTSNAPAWGPGEYIIGSNVTASSVIGTAGATAFTFTGEGTDTIPAASISVGDRIHVVAGGTVTTDGSESETLQLTFKIGSKTIYTSLANSYSTASSAVPWTFDGYIQVLTVNASTGTAFCTGTMSTDPGVVGSSIVNDFATSISSWDDTAANQITVTATWANGDASPDVATMNMLDISINNYD